MSRALQDQLTIVVPTYNRPDRLLRLLKYYDASACEAQIHVLDSSSSPGPRQEELEHWLAHGRRIHVKRYPPQTLPLLKMLDGIRGISTPYAVLCADDDFIIPGALEEGVGVLARHREVSVVHGRGVLFGVNGGRVQWVAPYLQRSVADETAAERLLNHVRRYSVMFYSVHRTEALRENLQRVCEAGLDWHTWGEIALSALAVIQGKAIALPRLYLVREGHEGMWSARMSHARNLDAFDWLTDTAFARQAGSYEQFRDCLVPELARQDGLGVERAREIVKQAFWPYLVGQMEEKWRGEGRAATTVGVVARIREAARRVPGLRDAWRAVRTRMPDEEATVSLEALRRPSSRHYRDFMPIYQAIMAALGMPAPGASLAPAPAEVAERAEAVSG